MGLINQTLLPIEEVSSLFEFSDPGCMMISLNHYIMQDTAFFTFLILFAIIMGVAMYIRKNNLSLAVMGSSAIAGVLGVFMWLMRCDLAGTEYGLLTTWQVWILPTLAILSAMLIWMTKD